MDGVINIKIDLSLCSLSNVVVIASDNKKKAERFEI
jgi:hypothetical protein